MSIYDTLNEQQREAVYQTEGPVLILAGAGSGKTRVLTHRTAYLIEEKGVNPYHIMAITFTNKAAGEMRERIDKIVGFGSESIWVSTFHSSCVRILRRHIDRIGFDTNFTIYDADDSKSLMKDICKRLEIDTKIYKEKSFLAAISSAKDELITPTELMQRALTSSDYAKRKQAEVYREYQEALHKNNALDFDDLIMKTVELLQSDPEVKNYYQERFHYIMVDEYQDTNTAQFELIRLLAGKYQNLCVVGDDDQSIYKFRGANIYNILNFEKDFPSSKVVLLEQNYRSTKTILKSANNVIKNNKQKKDKNLWTDNEDGEKINYYRAVDEKDESYYVATQIKKLIDNGVDKNQIAVLYRTNAQSRTIEEAMLKENIPYKVVGSFYFYNRKEIKDLISYLRLIYNPNDDVSLTRIINVPKRGIGEKTIQNIITKAEENSESMFNTISSGKELEFKKIILNLIKEKDNCSLTELVELILEQSGMKQDLVSEKTIDSEIRIENLEEFKSITRNFEEQRGIVSLEEFLEEISLVADISEHNNDTDVVTLMTVHSSKGLEFDNVFIIGLEEGVFPHKNSYDTADDIEEERRLCYVAITRACKHLYIVNSKKRMLYGLDSMNPPSRFINEMGEENLEIKNSDKIISCKFDKGGMIDKNAEYLLGDHVIHESFGEGVIVGMDKSILTIAFSHQIGIKMLMKGHKSIKKI